VTQVAAPAAAAPVHSPAVSRATAAPAAAVVRRAAEDPLGPQADGQCACGGDCPDCVPDDALQPKLLVGALDDPAEREADRLAEAIVGGGGAAGPASVDQPGPGPTALPTIRRCGAIASDVCPCHGAGGHDLGADGGAPSIARAPAAGAAPRPVGLAHGGPAPPLVGSVIGSGGGAALEPGLRTRMEDRFGTDFGAVRLHTDARANASAQAIGARAYTLGSDVVFGPGQYAPGTATGLTTLAHELAHVVQQQAAGPSVRGPTGAVRRQAQPRSGGAQYESRLVEGESIIQPPVSWTASPPDVERMSKLELFDALLLLDEWRKKHPKSKHIAALAPVRDQIRSQLKRITTKAEWSTYRRYVTLRPDQLQGRFAKDAGYLAADVGERGKIDLAAVDAVVRDRLGTQSWFEPARARLQGILAEQDRRATRFSTLRWYQRGSFELHERKARALAEPAGDLWRELAWLWIDLRDAGVDKNTAERRVQDEVASLYEQLLREVDGAIQAQCKATAPRTWDEKIRANIAKAWGDPCQPWFGPGGRGEHELTMFQMRLRIKRDDEPFARAYYWVEEYLKSYRSLTDPATQLAELRAQGMIGIVTGIAGPLAAYSRFMKSVMVPFLGRRFGGFLRHTIVGWNLALGDLGGSGAEVGSVGRRPGVAVVEPSGGGARPPQPDPVRRPWPDAPQAVKPPAPSTPARAPSAPRPAQTPAPTAPRPAQAPTATTAPPPATGMRPPPTPVRVRALPYRSSEAVRREVITRLSRHKTGMGTLPPQWDSVWDALRNNRGPVNDRIRDLLTIVMAALRNPAFYAEVMAEAWSIAWDAKSSINAALLKMAADAAMPVRVVTQRRAGEPLLNPVEFFEQYASQPAAFVDMPLAHNAHHAMTHLIQDLVVTRAFKAAGIKLTGPEFRALLSKSEGRFRAPRGAPIVKALWGTEMRVGDYVWQMTFDLFVDTDSHLPQPEVVGADLHDMLKIN